MLLNLNCELKRSRLRTKKIIKLVNLRIAPKIAFIAKAYSRLLKIILVKENLSKMRKIICGLVYKRREPQYSRILFIGLD